MMKGADEYYNLFNKSQQIGRLYFQVSTHARGKCFEIFLLPEGVEVTGSNIGGFTKDAVEVYGMVSGQRGWTEEYGWKHEGKWQDDFNKIVEEKREAAQLNKINSDKRISKAITAEKEKTAILLSNY